MGNCCCLVGGHKKSKKGGIKKSSKKSKNNKFFEYDYDDDFEDGTQEDVHCNLKKNIRRGGGVNTKGGGIRRPKNSKNNKHFLATYLATDLPNNNGSNSLSNATKSLLLNNKSLTNITTNSTNNIANKVLNDKNERCVTHVNGSSAALLSPSANSFVGNILNGNSDNIKDPMVVPPFPQPHKSTITYYQNKLNNNNNNNNVNHGVGCGGSTGKLFCGVTSNSSSNIQLCTPSKRGCDNSQIMNNLNKNKSNQLTNITNKLGNPPVEINSSNQFVLGNQITSSSLTKLKRTETHDESSVSSSASKIRPNSQSRRDSIDSFCSSSSSKMKILQRRKINFDQQQHQSTEHIDTDSIEVDIVEMDHSLKTSSISSCSSGIGVENNAGNRLNKKKPNNYRSLQKSKKSIKTIEATLRNSRSIEQWLNDFGKLQADENQFKLKSDHLLEKQNRYSFKICSTENLTSDADNVMSKKSVKRAKSFCDYENDDDQNNHDNITSINGCIEGITSSNTSRILIKKKKLKKNLKSKISLDENEEIFMNTNHGNDDDEEVKCELRIENRQEMEMDEEIEDNESETHDEHADDLVKLLLDINKEHDLEKLSTSSDANFKVILQQLIESSSKFNQSTSILHGLVNNSKNLTNQTNVNLNVIKLIDSIGHLMKTNNLNRIQNLEKEMRQHVSKFLLPRSLANSEDIDFLKWLLNEKNFHLTLCQPIVYETVYTQDRLTVCDQTNYCYLLNVTNLNVKLIEKSSSPDNCYSENSSSSDEDEPLEVDVEEAEDIRTNAKDRKFYIKFIHDSIVNDQVGDAENFCGSLIISHKKIKNILAKEKNLSEKCRFMKIQSEEKKNNFLITEEKLAGENLTLKHKQMLEKFRRIKMSTPNFRGAQCLLNIKNKQILNRKTTMTTTNLQKLISVTPPLPVQSQTKVQNKNGLAINTNGVGSNCSSMSSSISPSSASSTSSTNSIKNNSTKLKMKNNEKLKASTSSTATTTSSSMLHNYNGVANTGSCDDPSSTILNYYLTYSDLNERLFSCLLSNFSCKLVENFLTTSSFLKTKLDSNDNNNTNNMENNENILLKTGFIRKQKIDKSFSFINIVNEPNGNSNSRQLSPVKQETSNKNESNKDQFESPTHKNNHSSSSHHMLNLNIDTNTLKLCLKLNKWPQIYKREYFQRKRLNAKWPSKKLLNYIEANTCLITYSTPNLTDEEVCHSTEELIIEANLRVTNEYYAQSTLWQLDTRLAESILFKSLNQIQTFIFYFFYLIFNNLPVDTSNTLQFLIKHTQNQSYSQKQKIELKHLANTLKSTKIYLFNFLSERMFMHHFFRFFELNKFNLDISEKDQINNKNILTCLTLNFLFDLTLKFSVYMRFVIEKYKTLNKPNYFCLTKSILTPNEYQMYVSVNLASNGSENELVSLANEDLINAFVKFESLLNASLIKKLKKADLANNLKVFDQFLDIIHVRFGNLNNLTSVQISSPLLIDNNNANTQKLKTLEILMNLSDANKISANSSSKYYSPLNTHYSANTYVYIYIYEFFNALFEQFKSKRDNFQISEQLLIQLHTKILQKNNQIEHNEQLNDKFINAIKLIDKDRLLSQFEEYAECVHKYLPQIRQHNQYLLFHYVWTMQVQYLAPFFNYLCDFYPPLH